MGSIANGSFLVEYPGEGAAFKWSPFSLQIVRFGGSLTSLTIEVSDLDDTDINVSFTLQLTGNIRFDISSALQVCGERVSVMVSGNGASSTINLYLINGALGNLSDFGGEYNIRFWSGYGFKIPVFFYNSTQVVAYTGSSRIPIQTLTADEDTHFKLDNITVPAVADKFYVIAEGQVYLDGIWETSNWRFNLSRGCIPRNPIYLRWVDIQGLTWYWMFDLVDSSTTTEDDTEYMQEQSNTEDWSNEWPTVRRRLIKRTATILATGVTEAEYRVVGSLGTSAIVDAFDYAASKWYRVRVANGDIQTPKGNYKDVEFIIEFAPEKTQLP